MHTWASPFPGFRLVAGLCVGILVCVCVCVYVCMYIYIYTPAFNSVVLQGLY